MPALLRRPPSSAESPAPAQPCPQCFAAGDAYQATVALVRAAYRKTEAAPMPEELVARILAIREQSRFGLIHVLTGIAASPLLAFSVGL